MSFIALDGRERVKVSTSSRLAAGLRDVSRRENTYSRAETYFADLKRLKPGEIYVSEVIGPYCCRRSKSAEIWRRDLAANRARG